MIFISKKEEKEMLTISRELDDVFIVGNDPIIISILEIKNDKVKLGFISSKENLIVSNNHIIPHIKFSTY